MGRTPYFVCHGTGGAHSGYSCGLIIGAHCFLSMADMPLLWMELQHLDRHRRMAGDAVGRQAIPYTCVREKLYQLKKRKRYVPIIAGGFSSGYFYIGVDVSAACIYYRG